MNNSETQKWVKEAWKNSKKQVDEKMELIFLLEEIGEMAKIIRCMSETHKNKKLKNDLEKEMGDVLLALITIANRYGIDLEVAFEKTKLSIEKGYLR